MLYRHLGDRAGAWRAVIESVDALVWGDMAAATEAAGTQRSPRTVIAAITDSYLALVERDPEIYRFVVTRPLNDTDGDDPVAGMSSRMGERLTPVMVHLLRTAARAGGAAGATSVTSETARTLAHGLVGLVPDGSAVPAGFVRIGRLAPAGSVPAGHRRLPERGWDHFGAAR